MESTHGGNYMKKMRDHKFMLAQNIQQYINLQNETNTNIHANTYRKQIKVRLRTRGMSKAVKLPTGLLATKTIRMFDK